VTEEEVVAFFKKHSVVTWEQLTSYFGITRQALQRKIKGYTRLTSLNHNRHFLVLKQFAGKTNQYGIWSYRGILFSIHGNTLETVTNRFDLSVLDRAVVLYCDRPDTKLHCLENVITEDTLKLKLTAFV